MSTAMATNQAAFFQELARKINTAAAAAQLDAAARRYRVQRTTLNKKLKNLSTVYTA